MDTVETTNDDERTQEEARLQRIYALTQTLTDRRKEAIAWREQSGIEQEWSECEDAYEGIDDANRGTETAVSTRMQKPRSPNGGSIGGTSAPVTRSTVFLNITRPYTDAAAARVADMLLPSDDRNFAIAPTPIPELAQMPDMQLAPEQIKEFKAQLEAMAKERAEAAQEQIDDWLTECLYHAEVRKVIEDCARLGTGILKGPFPVKRKQKIVSRDESGAMVMIDQDKLAPASRCVSPQNLYPDPSCGEDINNGSFVFEKDQLSVRQVRELAKDPRYITEQVLECLREGPDKRNDLTEQRVLRNDESFTVWYFTGEITEADFSAAYNRESDPELDSVKVVCSIINDRIVRISRVPLDYEGFGYDLMPWQRRAGMPWGIGICKQISVPQRMLNANTRNLNDNSALSCGPQIVVTKGVIKPADGVFEITPRKVWFADSSDSTIEDVRKAFIAIDIPTRQTDLMNNIQFALKMAEDVTGLPMLMQGNQGRAPDTVGGMEILNTNANTVLRRIARTFDDTITEPHIRRYYVWIMEFGEENQKGDFFIDARGSTSLVERDIQRQAILGMGQVVLDPRFDLDPALWAEEALRANKIDPSRLKLTDAKKEQMQKAAAEQQQAAIAQAQAQAEQEARQKAAELEQKQSAVEIKAQADLAIAQGDNATDLAIAREKNEGGATVQW